MSNDNTNSDRPWWSFLARIFRIPVRAHSSKSHLEPQFMHSIVRLEGMESLQRIQGDTQEMHQGLETLKRELIELRQVAISMSGKLDAVHETAMRLTQLETSVVGIQQELQDFHRAYDLAHRKQREDLGRLEESVRNFSQTVLWGLLGLGIVGIGIAVWLTLGR